MPAIDLPPLWLPPKPAIIQPTQPSARNLRRLLKRRGQLVDYRWAGLIPPPMFYSAAAAYATRTNTYSTTGTSQNNTFTGVSFGTASGTSLVCVIVHAYSNGTNPNLSTFTIDGTTATEHQTADANSPASNDSICSIGTVTSANTSGTVVVNFSQTITNCRIEVYRLNNLSSATPDASNKTTTTSGTTINFGMNITAAGLIIAGLAAYGGSSGTPSITNVTNDNAGSLTGNFYKYVSASNENHAAATPLTITGSWAGTSTGALVAATWH